jgi:hypothetical protein
MEEFVPLSPQGRVPEIEDEDRKDDKHSDSGLN